MAPTRTTQPLRRKIRKQSAAVDNATRGRTVAGYNPQDAGRAAAKSTLAPQAKRPTPSGAFKPPSLAKKIRRQTDSMLRDRPRQYRTTRGKRRLSFEEAYSRRTTDSSRQRVLELYGKTEPPKSRSLAPGEATLPRKNGPQNLGRGNLAQNLAPPVRRRRKRSLGSKLRSV